MEGRSWFKKDLTCTQVRRTDSPSRPSLPGYSAAKIATGCVLLTASTASPSPPPAPAPTNLTPHYANAPSEPKHPTSPAGGTPPAPRSSTSTTTLTSRRGPVTPVPSPAASPHLPATLGHRGLHRIPPTRHYFARRRSHADDTRRHLRRTHPRPRVRRRRVRQPTVRDHSEQALPLAGSQATPHRSELRADAHGRPCVQPHHRAFSAGRPCPWRLCERVRLLQRRPKFR